MKTRYILFASVLLALCSCAKQNETDGRLVTFTAWNEGAEPVKSTVQNGGTQVLWEPGDAIKVFYGTEANRFDSQCSSLSAVSTFTGSLNTLGGANEGAQFDTYIWGLYPFRTEATSDGSSVTTTLPANQTGRAGGFAQNTNITLAHSNSLGLAFYNVCGGIRFTLSHSGVKRVILEGNNGETLAGTFSAAFENGVPVVKSVSEPAAKITLKAPGDSFEPGQWYYITCLPATLSKGFKLTFRSEVGSAVRNIDGNVSITRGVFGSLNNIDQGLEFVAGGGDDPEDINIEIDGEFWDWAGVTTGLKSTSSSPKYHEFKVHNDANYIYFYSKRDHNSAIWNTDGSQGYFYYDLDTDNNSATGITKDDLPGLEVWMYLMPFGGTPSAPAWYSGPRGSSYPTSSVYKSTIYAGAYTDSIVEIEVRLPMSEAGIKKGDVIGIYTWANKSAVDFKKTKLVYTVK